MYPLTGTVSAHVGGVQASLLAAERMVFRLHRLGLAWGTSGAAALCAPYPMPIIKKSQYRWQMSQPVPATAWLQPHRAFVRALGVAQGTARLGRELRVPPLEKTELLCLVSRPA